MFSVCFFAGEIISFLKYDSSGCNPDFAVRKNYTNSLGLRPEDVSAVLLSTW